MEEVWKDIKGFEGLYQISSFGRVKSILRKSSIGISVSEKILVPKQSGKDSKIGNGYYSVCLCKEGKRYYKYIHRLVAENFIPNSDKFLEVCHIDEDRHNNNIENLVWGTHKDNCNYPKYKERQSKSQKRIQAGEKNGMYGRQRTEEEKRGICEANSKNTFCDNMIFQSLKQCSEFYNINYSTMKRWMSGITKMPKDFKDKGLKYIDKGANNEQ